MINARVSTLEDIHEAFKNRRECFGKGDAALAGMLNNFERGRVYTLFDGDGNIGCVVGFVFIWTGVAECGAITTDFLHRSPISYTRSLRRILEVGMRYYKAHRTQITVQADYMAGHQWARALGFIAEGTLEKYSADKKDHVMYGRVTE